MDRGRPKEGTVAETVRIIHVGLDEASSQALRELERRVDVGVRRGRTSAAVRRALLEAAAFATKREIE